MTQSLRAPLDALRAAQRHPGDFRRSVTAFYAPDAAVHVVHPFNTCAGAESYHETLIAPLQEVLSGLYRRDDIVMEGQFEGADWISATGYYAGHFGRDWLGIRATDRMAYLRFGEFHRMEAGRAVESYIFLDLPEFMIAAGQWPIAESPGLTRGYTGLIQGPASQDGVVRPAADPAETDKSVAMVTDMLRKLATEDEAWRPFWHDNMVWYGPAAFGAFVGIERFASFQVPFEGAFEGWSGGAAGNGMTVHATRFADGPYICTAGWPSLTGVQIGRFLGQEAKGERLFMRVCDWWRREGDLLVENWVFVDIPDVLLQMGVDLFEGHHAVAAGPRMVRRD
ncbi:hypothetical protein ACS3SW_19395 [Roseobacteraceae bacterium S113]